MPDWFYRTVSRPLLFRLPAVTARNIALGVMGTLARLPLGSALIDLLGHMRAPARLHRSFLGVTFPSPVGLGVGIDGHATALPALARFGFGFLELGPVTVQPLPGAGVIQRRPEQEAIWYPEPQANLGLAALLRQLVRAAPLRVPLVVRLGYVPGTAPEQVSDACRCLVDQLAPHASLFSLMTANAAIGEKWAPEQWQQHLEAVLQAVRKASGPRPLLVCVPPDLDCADVERYIGRAVELGIGGVIVDGGIQVSTAGRLTGLPARHPALQTVQHLRQRWGSGLVIIGSGGIHEPEHALQFIQRGANLVQIDSGLVYAGPGLPKRTNEALLFAGVPAKGAATEAGTAVPAPPEMSWFWALLLGISMLCGGVLALLIASTRVVLHYDESFVGLTRAQLAAANSKLLLFMAHDRVTLAGTMITIGVLYIQLSLFGIRRGLHWARVTVLSSAFAGFGSFFLFLGFGYFDPFHAFVTAILFQLLLLALHSRQTQPIETVAPNLRDDWRWRWSLWGQLLFVVQGFVYIVAGLVIATVGITTVFVHEDLEFMETTAEALAKVSPRLLPLIAHDRASFGGMLIACGMAVLLPALWGYRRGSCWLWWALLAAGLPGYAAAIGVHLAVGYTNLWHLAPAFAGAAVFGLSLVLSYPYLCQADPWHEERWKSYRE